MIWIVSVKCFAWGGTKTGDFTDLRPFSNPMISELVQIVLVLFLFSRIESSLLLPLRNKSFNSAPLGILPGGRGVKNEFRDITC